MGRDLENIMALELWLSSPSKPPTKLDEVNNAASQISHQSSQSQKLINKDFMDWLNAERTEIPSFDEWYGFVGHIINFNLVEGYDEAVIINYYMHLGVAVAKAVALSVDAEVIRADYTAYMAPPPTAKEQRGLDFRHTCGQWLEWDSELPIGKVLNYFNDGYFQQALPTRLNQMLAASFVAQVLVPVRAKLLVACPEYDPFAKERPIFSWQDNVFRYAAGGQFDHDDLVAFYQHACTALAEKFVQQWKPNPSFDW